MFIFEPLPRFEVTGKVVPVLT